jgi:hypothetical protein
MDVDETDCRDVEWIKLAQDRVGSCECYDDPSDSSATDLFI